MKTLARAVTVAGMLIWAFVGAARAETAYQVAWCRQIGTSTHEWSRSVAVDGSGNAYITGDTFGSLGGTSAGDWDVFLIKYDRSGNVLWSRQIGTPYQDSGRSVAVDGSGNVYISGNTYGSLAGTSAGCSDAFLFKYDGSGNLLWSRQIGTSESDGSFSVAVGGSGNVYISGTTFGSLGGPYAGGHDVFLAKYDGSGNLFWSRQIGTSVDDYCYSVAVDASGNAYISGSTDGTLAGTNVGNRDAFLAKYDGSGNLLWTGQLGTSGNDGSCSVAMDASGNAYFSGSTYGSLGGTNAGSYDGFLTKVDGSGNLLWCRQIGTGSGDEIWSVAVDASGNAYISGTTGGSLGGTSAGNQDAFLAKYDGSGDLLWSRQIGTSSDDQCFSVAVDSSGNAYISGETYGSLGGPNAGEYDAFLVKYEVPEPATLSLLALGGLAALRRRKR